MNIEKGFTPTLDDEQKLASIKSQRDSIKKILSDLDRQEAEIFKITDPVGPGVSIYEAWKNQL